MIAALKTTLLLCGLLTWYGFIFLLVLLIPKNDPPLPLPLTVKLIQPVVMPTATTVKEVVDSIDKTPAPSPVSTKMPVKVAAAVHKKTPTQKKTKPPKTKPLKKKVAVKKTPSPKKQTVQPTVKNDEIPPSMPTLPPTDPVASPPTTPSPVPAQPKQQPIIPPVVTQKPPINAAYLHNPKPHYPKLSRRLGEQGKVMLRVKVDQSGNVEQIQINTSSGFARLDTTAQNTVQNWRFIPAQRNGQAISDWVMVPIVFNLTD